MRLEPKRVVAAACFLAVVGGFVWLSGKGHAQELAALRATLEGADPAVATIGPLTVSRGACRYFFPSDVLNRALDRLGCPSCAGEVASLRARFRPTLQEPSCARRGSNTILFHRE